MHVYRTCVATFAVLAVAATAAPRGAAAQGGLAWDSVTKLAMNADATTTSPGDFDQEYAQAAAVGPPPDTTGGGFMAKMNQAMAMGKHMQALLQNGFAEKHYIAGSKERTDQVADQTATIVDCGARTITTLDLRHKTYKVESMDAPSSGDSSGGSSAPGPRATDDGTKFSITIANAALGAREVGGQQTNGYQSQMSFTETKPSGESTTQNGNVVGYYSSYANPVPSCSWMGPGPGKQGQNSVQSFSAMTAGFGRVMRALAMSGVSSRFSLKQSGPPLPVGKLAMFEAATFQGGGRQGGGTFMTERGNVRAIAANDPIFSVPSDFTRQQ